MKIYNQPVELIIDTPSIASKAVGQPKIKKQLEDANIPVSKVRHSKPLPGTSLKKAAGTMPQLRTYLKTKIRDSVENPWDVAHRAHSAIANHPFVEPDFLSEFVADNNNDVPFKKTTDGGSAHGNELGHDPDWTPRQNIIWHLDDNFSQLRLARSKVKDINYTVRIGHLDTGIDKGHDVIPDRIKRHPLQRNFVEGEPSKDAQDPLLDGGLRNPGHGTGTMGILAGGKIRIDTDNGVFNEELGGAPFAEVIPCRIASSVVLIKTSSFAEALNYLTELTLSGTPIHVVSMSMGGAPARAWAEAVNKAYEAGITIVTAAGNHFSGLPTRHVIYPARFKRVIAACGVTWEHKAYAIKKITEMQGCFGPPQHMTRALGAFTPNTPWAKANTKNKISFAGGGTSSATPQVAAAAAIYYRQHHEELDKLLPWQRVEAVRNALFNSAIKKFDQWETSEFAGNGIIQANAALDIPVVPGVITKPDKVPFFPILGTLFKAINQQESPKAQMLNTELSQLVFEYPELQSIIGDKEFSEVSPKTWDTFIEAVVEHRASSIALKEYLIQSISGKRVKIGTATRKKKTKKATSKRTKKNSKKNP